MLLSAEVFNRGDVLFWVCEGELRQVFPSPGLHVHVGYLMESPSREAKGCAHAIPVLGWETLSATQVFTPTSFLEFFPDCTSTQTSEVGTQHGSIFCKERSDVTCHHRIWQLRDLNLDFLSCPVLSPTPACMHTCRVMIIINTRIIYITSYMITAY